MSTKKKILYVDMGGVLVNSKSALDKLNDSVKRQYQHNIKLIPNLYSLMDPIEGAVEAFTILADRFNIFILSTAPWENPSAWSDKLIWVQKHLGDKAKNRLILTHHKYLNRGDYLIDDQIHDKGDESFQGEHILFGQGKFSGWKEVVDYLLEK